MKISLDNPEYIPKIHVCLNQLEMEFKPIFHFFSLFYSLVSVGVFSLVDVTETPLTHHLPADAAANCFLPSALQGDCRLVVQAAPSRPKNQKLPNTSPTQKQLKTEENADLKKENSELELIR